MVASRGQVRTLEGVVAALLVLAGLTFALQTTAVTPLSASTASQHIENQQQAVADGILTAAAEDDELAAALLYWNETGERFHGADDERYYVGQPPANDISLYDMLEETFTEKGFAYNVYAIFQRENDDLDRQRVVYKGEPSDNAVTATRQVTLYRGDNLRDPVGGGVGQGGTQVDTSHTLDSTTSYFAPNSTDDDIGLYNVMRVEVVVWRM